jgi:hypothetical protein
MQDPLRALWHSPAVLHDTSRLLYRAWTVNSYRMNGFCQQLGELTDLLIVTALTRVLIYAKLLSDNSS